MENHTHMDVNGYSDQQEFFRCCRTLLSKKWKFASTMAYIPHWYTVRKWWGDYEAAMDPIRYDYWEAWRKNEDEEYRKQLDAEFTKSAVACKEKYNGDGREFSWVVKYLRKHGYDRTWGKSTYRYFDINDMHYWTMGCPVKMTTVINRAYKKTPFDSLADEYDEKYGDPKSLRNDERFTELLHNCYSGDGSVLEIGCATGTFSAIYKNYTGIDVSGNMVKKAKSRYLMRNFLTASLESYYTEDAYDFIFTTYGTASHFAPGFICTKLLDLLKPNGRFFLTYLGEAFPQKDVDILFKIDNIEAVCRKVGSYTIIEGTKHA